MNTPVKTCVRCNVEKPIEDFNKMPRGRLGRNSVCRACKVVEGREARESGRWVSFTAEAQREYRLKKNYGITHAQYEELFALQGGACALCGETDATKMNTTGRYTHGLVVDHDHESEDIRGLLCGSCNVWLGNYEELLRRAGADKLTQYLTRKGTWISTAPVPRKNTRIVAGELCERVLPDTKVCRGCGVEKPIGEFTISDKVGGYRKAKCKACEAARVAAYYASNEQYREATKDRARAWDLARREQGAPARSRRFDHEDVGV